MTSLGACRRVGLGLRQGNLDQTALAGRRLGIDLVAGRHFCRLDWWTHGRRGWLLARFIWKIQRRTYSFQCRTRSGTNGHSQQIGMVEPFESSPDKSNDRVKLEALRMMWVAWPLIVIDRALHPIETAGMGLRGASAWSRIPSSSSLRNKNNKNEWHKNYNDSNV